MGRLNESWPTAVAASTDTFQLCTIGWRIKAQFEPVAIDLINLIRDLAQGTVGTTRSSDPVATLASSQQEHLLSLFIRTIIEVNRKHVLYGAFKFNKGQIDRIVLIVFFPGFPLTIISWMENRVCNRMGFSRQFDTKAYFGWDDLSNMRCCQQPRGSDEGCSPMSTKETRESRPLLFIYQTVSIRTIMSDNHCPCHLSSTLTSFPLTACLSHIIRRLH